MRPGTCRTAPVKAPRSCPNSSLSINVSGMAAQLSATKGRRARGPLSCRARASASFPVPLSPSSSAGTETLAKRSTVRQTLSIASSAVTMPWMGEGRGVSARRRFSSSSSRSRRARLSATRSTAGSTGFSQKSYAPRLMARRAFSRCPWPLATITGKPGCSVRMVSSVAKPSLTPSGSGGSPRSSKTASGGSRRSAASAAGRSEATVTRQSGKAQRYWAHRPTSSSTTSRRDLVMRLRSPGMAAARAWWCLRRADCTPRGRRRPHAAAHAPAMRRCRCRRAWKC